LKRTIITVTIILTLVLSLFLLIENRNTNNVIVTVIVDEMSQPGDFPININTASAEALESLPGIGKVLADRIMKDRPFNDIHALDRVKGIGPKTIQGLQGKAVTN